MGGERRQIVTCSFVHSYCQIATHLLQALGSGHLQPIQYVSALTPSVHVPPLLDCYTLGCKCNEAFTSLLFSSLPLSSLGGSLVDDYRLVGDLYSAASSIR